MNARAAPSATRRAQIIAISSERRLRQGREAAERTLDAAEHRGTLESWARRRGFQVHAGLTRFSPASNTALKRRKRTGVRLLDKFRTGDFGPYWEDGVAADALYTAVDRSTQQMGPSAEALSTIVTALAGNGSKPPPLLQQMWDDMVLYAEHTFGAADPGSERAARELAEKEQFATDGREKARAVRDGALARLAEDVGISTSGFVVFNSLNWDRDGLVETDIDSGSGIVELPSLRPVTLEVLEHRPGKDRVRFLAQDVPSLGYRCYGVVRRVSDTRAATTTGRQSSANLPVSANADSSVIENAFYRIAFDTKEGAVVSIFDKDLHVELLDPTSPYRFDQYLYVSGGEGSQIMYLNRSLPLADLQVAASRTRLVERRRTPYGIALILEGTGLHTPAIRTEIVLFDREKKIEVWNHLTKDPVSAREAVYFAFPFAAQPPRFTYEIQNGVVDPSRDILKGGSLEWFTVQHWAEVAAPAFDVGFVPVDAPLITLGDINRGSWPLRFTPISGAILSYAMNNYWFTNYRAMQGGDFTFRYAVTSGRHLTPSMLSRFGRSVMTPLEPGDVPDGTTSQSVEARFDAEPKSFLRTDAENVTVESWRVAADGRGTILQLLETGGGARPLHVTFPVFHPARAWTTDAAENDQQALPIRNDGLDLTLNAHEIRTLRIVFSAP